jgi:hypothetical protein
MSRTISLPEDLFKRAEELAAREHVPVERFVLEALSEQFAGLEYLRGLADRASDAKFRAALDLIPDAEPDEHDRL